MWESFQFCEFLKQEYMSKGGDPFNQVIMP